MSAGAVRTWPVMGSVASLHVRAADAARADRLADAAAAAAAAELDELEALFSTYRPLSPVARIAVGTLALADAPALVREVDAAIEGWRERTGGRFDARLPGGYDPSGYVKGWAVERAYARRLAPLLALDGVAAVGLGVGGDVRLGTAPGADWTWSVGIVDPRHRDRLIGTTDLTEGAVASSGAAERGAHILDPRTGRPARGVAGATVIAPSLVEADVWATAAVVAGFEDLTWIAAAPGTTGLLVAEDGRVRRWSGAVEVLEPLAV